MSDTFWIQLFAFAGLVVTGIVAPIVVMYFRVKLRMERQFDAAREERNSVINQVAAVHSQIEDAKRAEELRFEETLKFQRKLLDSDMFAPGVLKAMAEKKRISGFGPLDP